MPTIRHRTGPLAGQEQTIDPRAERIMFGRDPAVCDVVFPPDLTLVARRHFAFVRKPSGEWLYEDFGDPFVSVNGHPAETDERIQSGALIELGKKGGPTFEIIFEGKGLDEALPATAMQQKVVGGRAAAAKARNMALGGAGLATVAVLATVAFFFFGNTDGSRLEAAVAELQKAQAAQAADSISAPVRDRLIAAAHVVIKQLASGDMSAQGSASPIGPDLLVTNAHVAALGVNMAPGEKLLVRAPGEDGKVYEIIEYIIHPGYGAFTSYMAQDPMFVTASKGCPTCFPSAVSGSLAYDVALLRVAPGSNLSPVLEIATTEELHALRPGMPMALAGYPLENIRGREMQAIKATPNYRAGVISAVTDMFNMPGDVEFRRQIHHNIPVTGGNSGSPMVGANGKLVALLNSGNVLEHSATGRMPNAAIINYGQRADLALQLLDGSATAQIARERAYWDRQTASFKRGFDLLVPAILAQSSPPNAPKPVLVADAKAALDSGTRFSAKEADGKDVFRRQRIHSVVMKPKVPGIFVAYAQERTPVQVYIVVNGQIVNQDARGNWFPHVRYTVDAETKAEVYVVGPDKDVNYTFLHYAWEQPGS